MSSQNSAWFFRHQVYNKLSNNQTQIELKLCPNHEGILFYVSTICQKKKSLKIPTQHRHQICYSKLFPFHCLLFWILNTSHFKHGFPNASSFTWILCELFRKRICQFTRSASEGRDGVPCWRGLICLLFEDSGVNNCYNALLLPSGWIFRKKERKSKVWGKVANLQHTWGITLRSTLRGQTAYQKEFLMSDSHSPRSFDPWWGKGALLNTSRPLGCSESGLRAKSGSRNTPRCKPGYRGSGT